MISFVVPAHDEEQMIGAALRAIRRAADAVGAPYELIVVADACSDGTAEVARAAGARVENVTFRQISRTRNAGARVARGERIIFVDADTIISEAVLRASLAALDRGAVGGGATLRMDGRLPLYVRLTLLAAGAIMRKNNWIAGCYVFCTRAAFAAAGGFDEQLFASEEIAFSKALHRIGRVVLLPETVLTSGRKARTHSSRDLLWLLLAFAVRGHAILRSRRDLALWYGERRRDPRE